MGGLVVLDGPQPPLPGEGGDVVRAVGILVQTQCIVQLVFALCHSRFDALGPAFESGRAQTAAWRAAEGLSVPRLASVSRDALRVWGVDAAGEAAIRAACASFVRASPVNLVFSGLLRRLLSGERPPGGNAAASGWMPPVALGPLPPLVDRASLAPPARAVLATLGTAVGGEVFVPALYRMLAGWPAFLAHVATVLQPHFTGAGALASGQRLLDAVDAAIPEVFADLPPVPAQPAMPPQHEFADVLAALDTYRKTSPEMVVFGRMLEDALPAPESNRT